MTITRRKFLQTSAAAPLALRAAAPDASERVLVVLQLAGGNDGLNTVIPYEDDAYARNRTSLRVTGSQVHKIGSGLGFHPEMPGFARLFQEGRLSIVQGVGYPAMNRDHGRGMRNWQTASPLANEQTGWLGRLADLLADPEKGNVPAVYAGRPPQPYAIRSREAIVPGIGPQAQLAAADLLPPDRGPARSNSLADFAARTTAAAWAGARNLAASMRPAREYPAYALAQSLRAAAQLVRAGIGIRIVLVEQGGVSPGGFDTHSNQAGNHAVLLRELSASVSAFCGDLAADGLLGRVLLMTYSEFGRTVSENGRHGTGHGAAAPVFLAGGALKGGLVGKHPSLTGLDADAPKPGIDFRSVYATAIERWLGIPAEPVLGARFEPLDAIA